MNKTCESCRYWDASEQLVNAQPDTTGACRVLPPRLDRETHEGIWPFTQDTDWCSAWTAFEEQ